MGFLRKTPEELEDAINGLLVRKKNLVDALDRMTELQINIKRKDKQLLDWARGRGQLDENTRKKLHESLKDNKDEFEELEKKFPKAEKELKGIDNKLSTLQTKLDKKQAA